MLGTFSERVIKYFLDRDVDLQPIYSVDSFVRELKKFRFEANDAAKSVIEIFGKKRFGICNGCQSSIWFGTLEIPADYILECAKKVELILGESCCPVATGGGTILFVCPSGKTVHLNDEWYSMHWSNSFAPMMEYVVFKNDQFVTEHDVSGIEMED